MTTALRHTAGEISAMLAGQIEPLCRELLPAGRRDGRQWRVGNLAGEPGASLSIDLGARRGLWHDFATLEGGDALDLVAAVLYRGDTKGAYRWALRWLGLEAGAVPAITRAVAPPRDTAAEEAEAAARRESAIKLFLAAHESLLRTPADDYLFNRGIDLRRLGRQPRALRFHPECLCVEINRRLPALVAAVSDMQGRHVATHRTWLHAVDGVWGKAPLREAKKTLGRPRGGTIRLWRGATGKSLKDAPIGSVIVLGEGIETCLSIALAVPELRVLCAVSSANAAHVELPDAIETVIWAADNDDSKSYAASERSGASITPSAGQRAVLDHLLSQGREVRIARSPVGKDFNDCVRVD